MYELIEVGERTCYINCPAKIGVFKQTETEVYLIDSGNDKDAGKKIKKIAEENGWRIKGIINTHSHADHIGGNKYLQGQTGCRIFAAGIETAFINCPKLEPSLLYGGYPFGELRHKFLLAQESNAVSIEDGEFPKELEVIELKWHFFDMVGIKTPDGVVFLADCVSSSLTLEKYKIPFIYDVEEYINTLDTIKGIEARVFVPSHADATDDICALADMNKAAVFELADKIKTMLNEPMCFERLLKGLFDDYMLKMTFEQHVLVGSTVRSFLSYLKDRGEIEAYFEDNILLWHSIEKGE